MNKGFAQFCSKVATSPIAQTSVLAVLAVLLTVSPKGEAEQASTLEALRARVERFTEPTVDGQKIFDLSMNVHELERHHVSVGSAAESIWSGDYWPLRYGSIAGEYKDGGYKTGLFGKIWWREVQRKFDRKWRKTDPRNLSPKELARLSPAEKVDIVLSNYDLTLSNKVWESIEEQEGRAGSIKMWEGVCHGWASAAIQAPRPAKSVYLRSRDGRYNIEFTPTDIKALSSYLWGKSLIQDYTRFEGSRCDNKKRRFDPLTRVSDDPNCQGVDPAVFHLSLVNLMGIRRESFIINKNTGTEVWNQPIESYVYRYFNLESGKAGTLENSIVPVNGLTSDIRKGKRAPETRYLVGIDMKLRYVKERRPDRSDSNDESNDNFRELHYIYDLELDEKYNVIGGEWRNYRTDREAADAGRPEFPGYPGFIWKIQRSEIYAQSIDDDGGPEWDVTQPIPNSFVDRQRQAADFRYKYWKYDSNGNLMYDAAGNALVASTELKPQPLGQLIRGLLRAAKGKNDHRGLIVPPTAPSQTTNPSQATGNAAAASNVPAETGNSVIAP